MSIESLLSGLELEAEKEKKEILEKAQAEAQGILKEAQDRANKIRSDLLLKAREEMDLEYSKYLSRAKSESLRLILDALNKELESLSGRVLTKVADFIKTSSYCDFLSALIKNTLNHITGKPAMEVSPQDFERTQKILKDLKCEASVQSQSNISSGFLIRSLDSRMTIDNTIEKRLANFFNLNRSEISKKLWPD